jgi:hypothetical protein
MKTTKQFYGIHMRQDSLLKSASLSLFLQLRLLPRAFYSRKPNKRDKSLFFIWGCGVFCRVLDAVPALNSSDVIDFYGSCATDPRGKDEIQTQRIEAQHMFSSDYEE